MCFFFQNHFLSARLCLSPRLVIKPSGDDAPTTNGESTEAVNEKKDTDAPLQVSMEEEPKEDFDATPVIIFIYSASFSY